MDFKKCKKCEREVPLNTDYYFKKKDIKDGFMTTCKECQGYSFTNHLSKSIKKGYKACIKCYRELKNTPSYYPVDRSCKDGLRNVCRECGKDGHFLPENYIPKSWWSKEEEKLFIERYPHYLNSELIEIFYPDKKEKSLSDKAYKLGICKSEKTRERQYMLHSEKMYGEDSPLYGLKRSQETREKISKAVKGKYKGENSYWYGKKRSEDQKRYLSNLKKGNWSGDNNPRHKDPLCGERNGRWDGGKTPLNFKIRNSAEYADWRISIFQRDGHTCQHCGNKNKLEAHHILNFSENTELRFDKNNGITLCHYCHNPIVKGSFHDRFGTRNNTREQLLEYFAGVSWSIASKKIYKEREIIG